MTSLTKPAALSDREWKALTTFYAAIDQHDFQLLHEALMPDWADLPQAPDQPLGPNGVKPVLPTGRKIALPLHEFHEFVDGRIAVTRHMQGWLELFAQLGAFPPSRTEPSEAIDD